MAIVGARDPELEGVHPLRSLGRGRAEPDGHLPALPHRKTPKLRCRVEMHPPRSRCAVRQHQGQVDPGQVRKTLVLEGDRLVDRPVVGNPGLHVVGREGQHRQSLGKVSVDQHTAPAPLLAHHLEHDPSRLFSTVVRPQGEGQRCRLLGAEERNGAPGAQVNTLGVLPFRLVLGRINETQVVHLRPFRGAHLDVDGPLVVPGHTQVDGRRAHAHPADHKLPLHRPVQKIRVNRPHLVQPRLSTQGLEGIHKAPDGVRVNGVGALKASHRDHQVQRHIGQRKLGGPVNSPPRDHHVLIPGRLLGLDGEHLPVIGGVLHGDLTGGAQPRHFHLVSPPLVVVDAFDGELHGHIVRSRCRHRQVHEVGREHSPCRDPGHGVAIGQGHHPGTQGLLEAQGGEHVFVLVQEIELDLVGGTLAGVAGQGNLDLFLARVLQSEAHPARGPPHKLLVLDLEHQHAVHDTDARRADDLRLLPLVGGVLHGGGEGCKGRQIPVSPDDDRNEV